MNKYIIFATITTILVGSYNANARYLGRRYVSFNVGNVTPGDDAVKDFDDSVLFYGANLRLPVSSYVDIIANAGQAKMSGEFPVYYPYYYRTYYTEADGTSTSVGGGVQIHFFPTEIVDPYLGVGFLWNQIEFDTLVESTDDDDTSIVAGGGLEISANEKVSINVGVSYQGEMYDEDEILGDVGLNVWVNSFLLLAFSAEYGFNSEDFSVSGGLGIGF